MLKAPAPVTSAAELTKALTHRPEAEFVLDNGGERYLLHLRSVGFKAYQLMMHDAQVQTKNAGMGLPGALAALELQYIQHGVIDPETHTPLFKSKEEIAALLEGNSVAVEELIHRIKVLSGISNPVSWDEQLEATKTDLVDATVTQLTETIYPLINPECQDVFKATIRDFREALDSYLRVAFDHVGFICVKKFQYGDEAPIGFTEEDLGNSSEQTPDSSTSGASASNTSEDSPAN